MDFPAPAPTQAQKKTIPLVCNICARNPNFSDLSHLLTHISSKAHLSTYYKIKVRSAADEEARQSIEHYDIWYAENDIEAFMSERMNQKEERKKIKTEPHANKKTIKKEDDPPAGNPSSGPSDDASSVYPLPYAAFAPMYSWGATPYLYSKPEEPSLEDGTHQPSSDMSLLPSKRKAKGQTPHVGDMEDDDASKLKGVVWPGMGLFDAATPELKKKRNQKKDTSVNDRLATMSELIHNKELVFSPGGRIHKVRAISGQPPAEDDLLSGEELPPRSPKAKRASRRKTSADKKSSEVEDPEFNTKTIVRPRAKKRGRKQQAATAVDLKPHEGDQVDDESTHKIVRKAGRNKRKRAAMEHDEEAEDTEVNVKDATVEQPTEMAHLTSGYHQGPMFVVAAPMGFRAAEPSYMNMNMTGQSFYQFPTGEHNGFPYEPSPLATWEHFGYGMGSAIVNPLFGLYTGVLDDDDEDIEGTISAPISDSDK